MLEEYYIKEEPFYVPIDSECEIFEAAAKGSLPIMLKGPTGCGKTRLVEHMAYKLGRPLISIPGHNDLGANDLMGRYLFKDGKTEWVNGPILDGLEGAVVYLDEIAEARPDVNVVIHSLTDHRRQLSVSKLNKLYLADPNFMLVASYNPKYQQYNKGLKTSTLQRFTTLDMTWPTQDKEIKVLKGEAKIDENLARNLVLYAQDTRNLAIKGDIKEGASTRLIVNAGILINNGLEPKIAITSAITNTITDEKAVKDGLIEAIDKYF